MIRILFAGSVSACFETDNTGAYYNGSEYTVSLDGKEQFRADTNVFSLFGLTPGREYELSVTGHEPLKFTTAPETCAVSVKDFGAAGDGVTDDTQSIQTAVNCLPAGGRLYFPEGVYYTAPIALRSHITLELAEKAVLLGHTDQNRYPVIPGELNDLVTGESVHFGAWEGNAVPMHQSLLFAEYAEDIRIVGRGTVDGNARNAGWWENVKERVIARPRLLFFNRCKDITVHGITAQNAASWQFHPYFSEKLDFLDLAVNAPKDSPNTDAMDPEACDNVNIIGCRFSVGDDCIAIKSGKIELGRKYKRPASRHTIRNCVMRFGHGAITLGSEMAGGVKDLTVERCLFEHTDRGIRIKTRRGRGKDAVIDGVVFENVKMDGVLTPIVMNMWYNCCDPDRYSEYNTTREKLPVDDRTPYLGKFSFRDMECLNCHVAACYCDGLPEMPIGEITLENIKFTYDPAAEPGFPSMKNNNEKLCRAGMYFDNVGKLTIRNVTVDGCEGDELIAHNVGELVGVVMYKDIDNYISRLVKGSTPDKPLWNIESILEGKSVKWNYIDGCMITALLDAAEITGEKKYFDFAEHFIDWYVRDDGSILGYSKENYNVDDVNEGRVLFDLYKATGKEKYRKAIELIHSQLAEQPRTSAGSFWHKKVYHDQVWLDGIYMAQVFSTRYQKEFGGGDYSDIMNQIKNVRRFMFDEEKGLFYHGYDSEKTMFWADKETGLSKSFWLRSIGWFTVALADIIDYIDNEENRAELAGIFREAVVGIAKYADPETGMFWQVVDQGGREGNYLETSGSSMIAYAMMKGARLGILDKKFAEQGRKTFDGICRKYLKISDNGELNLGGICLMAGLGPESDTRRDGSYEYYISEPIVENDAKGVAPFVLCYTEVKRMLGRQ